jgi:L-iditol 2-dehydrogenase
MPAQAVANLAAVLDRPGSIRIEQRPVPEPGPREVLVEIASVGVCGSDVHYYREGRIGDFVVTAPLVLGHEASGRVIELGMGATGPAPGTLVAIEPGVPCRHCDQCRSGRYNLCPDVRFLATPPVDGAFTRYLAVPEDFCYPVPESMSADEAALIEPLSVGVWACRKAGTRPGERVLVTGAGPIGLVAALVAGANGASVTICDINPVRLKRAADLGVAATADLRHDDLAGLGPASSFIECTGADGLAGQGLAALAPGGTAVLVGMSAQDDLRLPLSLLQTRELVVTGTFRYANCYPAAIALAASGAVPLRSLVDGIFGLRDAQNALQATTNDPSLVKVVVHPHDEVRQETDPAGSRGPGRMT